MKKVKNYLAFLLVMVMAVGCLAVCPVQAAAADDTIVFSVGYENNPGEIIDQAVNLWAEELEKISGGTMKLELYPSSQLGTKYELFDQMIAGDYVITLSDGIGYADYGDSDMAITGGYGVFDSWDQFWEVVDSDWYKGHVDYIRENIGLNIIDSKWQYGVRHLMATKPIRTVDDMVGLKTRVPTSPMHVAAFELTGAKGISMNLGEVYTALQQGVVDAVENPLNVLYSNSFYEVCKYLTLTGHSMANTTWCCGTIAWESLTEEQQGWLVESCQTAGVLNNQLVDEAGDEFLAKFEEQGVEIIEMTEEAQADFMAAMRLLFVDSPVADQVSQEAVDAVSAIVNK